MTTLAAPLGACFGRALLAGLRAILPHLAAPPARVAATPLRGRPDRLLRDIGLSRDDLDRL